MPAPVHYADYLQLDTILKAQRPESALQGKVAHDEMLFIITHQTYELWFKQLLYEVDSVMHLLGQPALNDNSPELQTIVHRLSRTVTILKLLVQQIDVMETMSPMDFLDFRNLLRPASGFQSWQFKVLEAKLGLKYENRFGQEYYLSQLRPAEVALIKQVESEPDLLALINGWLARMPFFAEVKNWEGFSAVGNEEKDFGAETGARWFWNAYYNCYRNSLDVKEVHNEQLFLNILSASPSGPSIQTPSLTPAACRAALFIMLYRGYPILQLPFQVLSVLLEIDEQLSTWRYRHWSMVQRIIGSRIGTGGSTGKAYLKGALDRHLIFGELAQLTSLLVERSRLPTLTPAMQKRLGFEGISGG